MVTLSYLIGSIKSLFDLVVKNAPVLDNYVEINEDKLKWSQSGVEIFFIIVSSHAEPACITMAVTCMRCSFNGFCPTQITRLHIIFALKSNIPFRWITVASQIQFLLKLHGFEVKLRDDLKIRIKGISQDLLNVYSKGQGLIGVLYKLQNIQMWFQDEGKCVL